MVSTSIAKHFATCVAKPVKCLAVLIVFNKIFIRNPNNIEASRICWYLLNQYTGIFDITYMECQLSWISQEYQNTNTFNYIELLTVYCYNDIIIKQKEERSMIDLKLIGFKG